MQQKKGEDIMERTKEGESKARRTRRVNVREKAITLIAQISDEISPQQANKWLKEKRYLTNYEIKDIMQWLKQ